MITWYFPLLGFLSTALNLYVAIRTWLAKPRGELQYSFLAAVSGSLFSNVVYLLQYFFFMDRMNQIVGLSFLGIAMAPAGLFLAAWYYSHPDARFRKRHLLAFVVPSITVLASFTNPLHHWMARNYSFFHSEVVYGPYFIVHTLYSFGLVLASAWLFLSFSKRTSGLVSYQSRLIIAGSLIPVLQATGLIFKLFPSHQLLNSAGFSVSMLLFWRAIIHYRFLDIRPLALQTIVDHIAEGFVVLSRDNTVVNFNLPFMRMFDFTELASNERRKCGFSAYAESMGIDAAEILGSVEAAVSARKTAILPQRLESGAGTRHIDIEITPVFSGKAHIGSILLFKDETELRSYVSDLQNKNKEIEDKVFQIEELNKRLKSLADTDGLTGAYNRRFFDEYVRLEASRLSSLARHRPGMRAGSGFGLALLDVDHFKGVNDRWGHVAGDYILKEIVRIIKMNVFGRDVVCRYGGEEFAIIYTSTDIEGLRLAAEKIRASIQAHGFLVGPDAAPCPVTVSVGIAVAGADPLDTDPRDIIRVADENLYRAKVAGRNRVVGNP
jgi:diguanylate cyclase (GGDEF)-like protein